MRATISILGLTSFDESIWDNLQVPAQANKQDIIDEILLECSDFELLYPDWDVMKGAIGLWSRKELPIWERLYKAKELEYNPLWNVDATIKEIRDVTDNSNYQDNTAGNTSQNIDEAIDETVNSETDGTSANTSRKTGTEQVAGTDSTDGNVLHQSNTFNSGTMIDNSKDISESDTTSNQTTTFNTTIADNGTTHDEGTSTRDFDRNQDTTGTYDEEKTGTNSRATHDVYDVVRQGNIGVTSSQQLLTEEWEVSQLDPEQYIIDSFKQRFCLLLY